MEEDQGIQNGNFTKEVQEGEEVSTQDEESTEKSLTGSTVSVHEKQDSEQSEEEKDEEFVSVDTSLVKSDLVEPELVSLDTSLVKSDLAEPLLSDEDDHDRLETDKQLRETNMAEVVSDTEISEIPIQDNASDREILDDEVDEDKDISTDRVGSVSDDSEHTISEDKYLQFPTPTKQDISNETDDIIQGLTEVGSVVSDIFVEAHPPLRESSPGRSSDARFDSSRSRYTRPRMPQPSYTPFIRPAPIGYYLDDDEVHVS